MSDPRGAEEDPRRRTVRERLARLPHPTGRELAEAGFVAPHLPPPYGLGSDPIGQLIIDDELASAGISRPYNPIGIGWAVPTLLAAGTAAQQERYIMPALAGDETWCQLFSEPDAGSDLASLTTRAERRGDEYVVNGVKTWTSLAHVAQFGILLARTDPHLPRHRGITYFICPLDTPGITRHPIVDMTGGHSLNQVHLEDVRLPSTLRVGDEGEGWQLAKITLANERVSLSTGGALWGIGPTSDDLVRLVREQGPLRDGVLRQRVAEDFVDAKVLDLLRVRTLAARLAGHAPGPEASVQKIFADEHGQTMLELAQEVVGAEAMLRGAGPRGGLRGSARHAPSEPPPGSARIPGVEPVWQHGFLFSPALTIGGGTWAVQRDVVADRILGLPREPAGDARSASGTHHGSRRPRGPVASQPIQHQAP